MPDRNVVATQQALKALSKRPLSMAENRVLWHLAATLPPTGDLVSKAQLEEVLSISQVHLNAVMRRLCQYGFLIRGPKAGRSYHYKLNPALLRIIS